MIQVLDLNDREIHRFKLVKGENRFGSDPKQCQFQLPVQQAVLFSMMLIDNDVYFTHFSVQENVFKDSTLPPHSKVLIPKNTQIEMALQRNYYFQGYKFRLLDDNNNQFTQLIEEYCCTVPLDDIIQQPQFAPTQVFCQSTLVLDDQTFNQVPQVPIVCEQISELTKSYQKSSQDVSTQTEEQQQVPKKNTLFSDLFKSKKLQQSQQQQQQQQQENKVQKQQLPPTIEATVQDEDQQQFFEKKMEGTVIDVEMEQVLSKKEQSQSQQQSSLKQSLFKRAESFQSDQSLFKRADSLQSEQQPKQNIELTDLFGSLPELPQIVQPVKKQNSLIKHNMLDEVLQKQEETPLKQEQQKQDEKSEKKQKKKQKNGAKKGGLLKKITDEISEESEEEQKVQPPRQTNSMELPASKILEEKGHNNVPKKKRGLRKKLQKKVSTIAFSGFQVEDIKFDFEKLDLEYIDDPFEKFDILVMNYPPKRTFKFLAALLHGAEVVTIQWLKDSLQMGDLQNFQDYVPESKEFEQSFGLNIKQILQNRDDYFESHDNVLELFEGKYYVKEDVVPSKAEIEYLIKLGGGEIVKKALKKTTIISDTKQANGYGSDHILDTCMF